MSATCECTEEELGVLGRSYGQRGYLIANTFAPFAIGAIFNTRYKGRPTGVPCRVVSKATKAEFLKQLRGLNYRESVGDIYGPFFYRVETD